MNNNPSPIARLYAGRIIIAAFAGIFLFCVVLLITPIWLILVICHVDVGNPWRWLSIKWKELCGDYEGAARAYEEDARRYEEEAQKIAEQYNLSVDDNEEEAEELRKKFIEAVGEPDEMNAVSQLVGLVQKGFISEPEYEFFEDEDVYGNTEWECTISVPEYYEEFTNRARYKRDVKRMCAYEMYQEIFNNPLDE